MDRLSALLFVALIGAAIVVVAHAGRLEWPEEMRIALVTTHDYCMKEAGAKVEDLMHCKGLHIPGEPTSKCYLSCMLEHAHFNETTKTAVILKDVTEFVKDTHDLNDRLHAMTDISHGNCDHLGRFLFHF